MIRYRHAVPADVGGIDRVVRAAYNALSRKHGFAEIPPGPAGPFYAFAIAEEGEGCWVAEEDGAVIGAAIASLRGTVWFLAYLFIDPAIQTRGVGRELLARALAYGGLEADVRSLVTLAYNPVSIGLYLHHGVLPIEPLYVFDASAPELQQRLAGHSAEAVEIVAADVGAAAMLARIDEPILEGSRLGVHRYLLQVPGNVCHLFRVGGEPCGYAYLSAGGRVGPVAAAAPLSFERVLATALGQAARSGPGRVSVLLAGSNAAAVTAVTRLGMRVVQPLLLMASRRFGDLDRYAFHSPGIM
jgi:GNAT superfamily N-acetyltransferase